MFHEQDLSGKVALVTGATKGIGRAICLELAARGCLVLGTYASLESGQLFQSLWETAQSAYSQMLRPEPHLNHPPTLVGISANITTPEASVSAIVQAIRNNFGGKIDIVVLNAAIMGLARMGEGAVTSELVDRALAGNTKFPIALIESLVKDGMANRDGRVVAISSEGVRARRPPGGVVYAATKAAIECLMRQWADELGKRPGMGGTTFDSISVGFTKTEAYGRIPPGVRDRLTAADATEVTAGDRISKAEDVADIIGLLVSDKARWISGSVIDANGGKRR